MFAGSVQPTKSTLPTGSAQPTGSVRPTTSVRFVCLAGQDEALAADLTYCFIFTKTWTGPSQPETCEGDNYEREIAIGPSGKAANRCDGQPQFAYDPNTGQVNEQVLDYGHAFELNGYRCASQQTGIRCDNTRTGHGFTLSREAYKLY